MSRSGKIRDTLTLKARSEGWTASEICQDIGEPQANVKFVSSWLVGAAKSGKASEITRRLCGITGRTVGAWALGSNGQPPPPRQPKAPKAPRTPKQPKAAAPQTPPVNPVDQAKADARRLKIEAELRDRQARQAALTQTEQVKKARADFQKLTGYFGKNLDQAKQAYKLAARKHHPDCGGKAEIFTQLNTAWSIWQKELAK